MRINFSICIVQGKARKSEYTEERFLFLRKKKNKRGGGREKKSSRYCQEGRAEQTYKYKDAKPVNQVHKPFLQQDLPQA